jgi:hypothetical protein
MKSILPDDALAQHLAIVGNVGSGKTYTAKGLVEGLLAAKRRVCILDPTGAWWGLRSSSDGKRAGYSVVVFGGEHADVPINPLAGAALAKIIATKNLPAIIDLSEMLIGERHRFVLEFAETLYKENRAPLHLVIDEADEFCPQMPMPETRRMLHHVDRIVRRGRIKGFRVMLITQRPAVVNKNVLTQVQTLIALRLTSPQDRKAILAWVEGQADKSKAGEVMDTLAKLKRGEGWVWSPANDLLKRIQFGRIETFDSSRTPDDGVKIAAPTKLARVDLKEIRESFAAIEVEATTMAELKAANKKLTADLAKLQTAKGNAKPIDSAAQISDAVERARKTWMAGAVAMLNPLTAELSKAADLCSKAAGTVTAIRANLAGAASVSLIKAAASSPRKFDDPGIRLTRTPIAPGVTHSMPTALPKGEALVLAAIAQYPEGVDRPQLTALCGYKQSARDTYISRLSQRGLVEVSNGVVTATSAAAQFGPFEKLPTGSALLAHWLDKLSPGERSVLQFVAGGQSGVTREQISEAVGYKQSARDTYISRLNTRKLVVVERGIVRAADILFD